MTTRYAIGTVTLVDVADGEDSVVAGPTGTSVAYAQQFDTVASQNEMLVHSGTKELSTDNFSGAYSYLLTSAIGGDLISSGSGGAFYLTIPEDLALSFVGSKAVFTVYAKPPAENPSAEFALAYSTSEVGNSGFTTFSLVDPETDSPKTEWEKYSAEYIVPEPAAGGVDYLIIAADTALSGKSVLIDNVRVGIQGPRGAGWYTAKVPAGVTSWSLDHTTRDAEADAACPDGPQLNDRVTLYSKEAGNEFSTTRYYQYVSNTHKWQPAALVIDGSLIVKDTVSVDKLLVNGAMVTKLFAEDVTATGTITGATLLGGKLEVSSNTSSRKVTIDSAANSPLVINDGTNDVLRFDADNKLQLSGGLADNTINNLSMFSNSIWSQIKSPISEGATGGSFTAATASGESSITSVVTMTNVNTSELTLAVRFNSDYWDTTTVRPDWTLTVNVRTCAVTGEGNYTAYTTIHNQMYSGYTETESGEGTRSSISINYVGNNTPAAITLGGDVQVQYTVTHNAGSHTSGWLTSASASQTVAGGGQAGAATLLNGKEGSYYLNYNNFSNTPTVLANDGTSTGTYSTSGNIQSGRGSGGVALTINDGYGNANVTFNHQKGVPEQTGNAARIEFNTDGTSNPTMTFELGTGTSGAAFQTPTILTLTSTGAAVTGTLSTTGGNSTDWNTAYTYSQVGHVPLVGGTMTGNLTVSNGAPSIKFNDTDSGADDFWIHINSDIFYILTDRDDSGSWDGNHPLQLRNPTSDGLLYGAAIYTANNFGKTQIDALNVDASTVDGYSLSKDNGNGDTIAQRNGSGDIHARLLRSSYSNQNTISGALAFRVNGTNDNYNRYCSDRAAIRTWLDLYNKGEADARYVNATDGLLEVDSTTNTDGAEATLRLNSASKQGCDIRLNTYDSNIAPFGVHIERAADNAQTSNKAYLSVQGNLYMDGDTMQSNGKTMFKTNDNYLRINDQAQFTSGIYCGTMKFRADGQVRLGTGGNNCIIETTGKITSLNTVTGTDVIATSDIRVKQNLQSISNAALKLRTLRTTTHDRLDQDKVDGKYPRRASVIAQDIEAVLPEAINYIDDDTLGTKLTVSVPATVVLTIAAVNEHTDTIAAQAKTIVSLEERLARLEALVEASHG